MSKGIAAGRTEQIRHFVSDGSPLAYFDYSHDARSDITKIARLDGVTTYYDSDAIGRLTGETWKDAGGTAVYAFTYDGYDAVAGLLSANLPVRSEREQNLRKHPWRGDVLGVQ